MPINTGAVWPIQTAIYSTLNGDAALMGKITGVHDLTAPDGTAFPYVTIGHATAIPQGAHDRFGSRTTVTLHIWSTHRGKMQVSSIADEVLRLLDHQSITVEGHHLVSLRLEQMVTASDPDPDVSHLAMRFSFETELVA